MIWVLMSLLGLSLVALAATGLFYGERMRQVRTEEKAEHAKCVAHIAHAVSHRVVAQAFRFAADQWDSIEGQADLQRLAREQYKPGGPSMPAIWMRERANLMETFAATQTVFHDMTGERVL